MPDDGVMITQRGEEFIEERPSYASPLTSNVKFDMFVGDLFSLKLKPTEIKKNITDYVQAIETHYTGIIEGQKIKMDRVKKDCKTKIG